LSPFHLDFDVVTLTITFYPQLLAHRIFIVFEIRNSSPFEDVHKACAFNVPIIINNIIKYVK